MQVNKYQSFTNTEFLQDPDFIRFIKEKNPDDVLFWEEYENSALNIEPYLLAKKELEFIFLAKRIVMPAALKEDLLAKIDLSIDQYQQKRSGMRKLYVYIGAAAAILTMALFTLWLNSATVTISTTYGQRKDVTLPDGSTVTLNANSSIKYPLLWRLTQRRNVQLKGEAYFKVIHLNKDQKNIAEKDRFQVLTDHLHIEVLGTEFDVKDRNQLAKIVLTKGSVKVSSLISGRNFILKPRQMALETKEEALKVVQADPAVEHAWVDGNMKMQKTSVKEVMQEFEELYGKQIILSDPAMASIKIDGAISLKSEDNILFVLANILNAKVKKDSNTVVLEAKK